MFILKECDLEKMRKNEKIGGFSYPEEFLYIIDLNLINFEIWSFFSYESALSRMKGLKTRYPEGKVVPFAKRNDNDDIACFDIETREVFVIHDFSCDGYKNRKVYRDFQTWFKVCIDDMFEYIHEEIAYLKK